MIVRNRPRFVVGAVGLVTFFAVLTVWMSPIADGKSGLVWADGFFNQLSKSSAYRLPELLRRAPDYRGQVFDVTVKTRTPEDAARLAKVFAIALGGEKGPEPFVAEAAGSSVHLKGDLGAAAAALLADAEPVYRNQDEPLQGKYGMSGREVLYWYWTGFGEIYKHYMGRAEVGTANFASAMRTKVCEPIYNFHGIPPARASEAMGRLVFLLGFYVLYTLWYGFSIMFLFEGMDISAQRARRREV